MQSRLRREILFFRIRSWLADAVHSGNEVIRLKSCGVEGDLWQVFVETRMLIVLFVFAVVFLMRDVQVLAAPDRRSCGARFAAYASAIIAGLIVVDYFR